MASRLIVIRLRGTYTVATDIKPPLSFGEELRPTLITDDVVSQRISIEIRFRAVVQRGVIIRMVVAVRPRMHLINVFQRRSGILILEQLCIQQVDVRQTDDVDITIAGLVLAIRRRTHLHTADVRIFAMLPC